jgi:putative methyltransferase (TIGR04325 family)
MMSYGYVLGRAARNKTKISVLDWGGGAGHYYLYSKALLPEVTFDYHCVDVPALCQAGRQLLPEVQFHEWEMKGRAFDLVISSSSLHYLEHWRKGARKIADACGEFLYLARLQTVFNSPSFVALHKLKRAGYPQFVSWCLNRQEVVDCLESLDFDLLREFVYASPWCVRGAPEKAETRGFLFRRKSAPLPGSSSNEAR